MVSARNGDNMAALNWALATRSACLTEGVKSLAMLGSATFERQGSCEKFQGYYDVSSVERPFASCGTALRAGQSALGKGVQRFFQGFFTPPSASRLASLSPESWQTRVASNLASVVVLRNGKVALSGVTVVNSPKAHHLDECQVRSVFNEIDTDGNGFIERHELVPLLEGLGLPASNNRYVNEVLDQYRDTDGSDRVSYESFRRYIQRVSNNIGKAFEALDSEGSGMLTESGLVVALRHMGFSAEREDALKMIQLLDRNHDKTITINEFLRFACMLPAVQLKNDNIAFCWVDSTDYVDGMEFRLSMMQRKQTAKRLFAGGFAGALSRSMVAPLERLRTIMMASPVPITMRTAVEQMWNDGGAAGLFKGNMASVIKVLPSSAVQFAVYDHCSDAFKALRGLSPSSTPHIGDRLAAGVVAGAAACVVTYPLDTIRTMMCVPGVATGNFFRTLATAIHARGILGLYSGFQSSLLSEMTGTGLGFMAYEAGNQWWERTHGHKPTPAQKGGIGAASAFVVMTCTMPLELIQRRMQVAAASSTSAFRYSGPVDAFVQIVRKEGFRTFYRGSLFAYAKVVPSIGAMYMLYDLSSHALAIGGLRRYIQGKAPQDQQATAKRLEGADDPNNKANSPCTDKSQSQALSSVSVTCTPMAESAAPPALAPAACAEHSNPGQLTQSSKCEQREASALASCLASSPAPVSRLGVASSCTHPSLASSWTLEQSCHQSSRSGPQP